MPSRIYRYLARRFFSVFLAALGVFSALLLMDQASRQVEQLAPNARGVADLAVSFLLLTPPVLAYSLPLAFLMAMISCLEQMKQDRELQAVLSVGVSPSALFAPFLALAAATAAAALAVTALAGPASYRAYNDRLSRIAREKLLRDIRPGAFYKGIPGTVLLVGGLDPSTGALSGLLVAEELSPSGADLILARAGTISQAEGEAGEMLLSLQNGTIHPLSAADRDYRTASFGRLTSRLRTAVEDRRTGGRAAVLSERTLRLSALATQARGRGETERAAALELERGRRFAVPLLVLVYPFLVYPLAVSTGRQGKAAAFSASLALFLAGFFLYSLGAALGIRGWIPPVAGAFLPVAVFASAAVLAFGAFLARLRPRGAAPGGAQGTPR